MPRVIGQKDAKGIGERLKKAREEKGVSQSLLGKDTGMTGAYVSRIEKGDRGPTLDAIRAFAHRLEVSAYWLETGKGNPVEQITVADNKISEAIRQIDLAMAKLSEAKKALRATRLT